jgi:hypothetical protein
MRMPMTVDDLWREDWREVSGGLMNAATGIALGIALGLSVWGGLIALLWMLVR